MRVKVSTVPLVSPPAPVGVRTAAVNVARAGAIGVPNDVCRVIRG
jgi:hypothetical protein